MSGTLSRLGRNVRWLTASEAANRVLGLLFTALAARALGLERLGLLTLCLVYTEAFQLLSGFSFYDVVMRDGARRRDRLPSLLAAMVWVQVAALPVCMLLAWLLGLAYGGPLAHLLVLSGALGWLRGLSQTWLAVPAAEEDFRPTAIYALLERLVGFAALAAFLLATPRLATWLGVLVAGSALTALYAGVVAGRRLPEPPSPRFPRQVLRGLIRDAFGFATLRWIGLVHNRLDTVLVERLLNPEALGIYAAAYRLLEVFKNVPNIAERALFPVTARAGLDPSSLAGLMRRFLKGLAVLTVPLALGAWALAVPVVLVAFGEEFRESAAVWPVLMAALVIIGMTRPYLVLVRTQGRLRGANLAAAVAALSGLGLNLWLLPRIGVMGAALATIAAEVILLAGLWLIARDLTPARCFGPVIRVLVSGAAAAVAVGLLLPVSPWPAAAAGLVVYLAGLAATRALDAEDLRGLRAMMGGGPE